MATFCQTSKTLLDNAVISSEGYYQALTKLCQLVGCGEPEAFRQAKRVCVSSLNECRRSSVAFKEHKADHGC